MIRGKYFLLKLIHWSLIAAVVVYFFMPIEKAAAYQYEGTGFSVNYTSTDITQVPLTWIEKAKSDLHIAYGHTSHGRQIIGGMTGLVDFANNGGKGLDLPQDTFAWNDGGIDGALDIEEGSGNLEGWLSGDLTYYPQWVNETIEYLGPVDNRTAEHADVNVVIWSWCVYGDSAAVKYARGALDDEYLLPMTELENEYPDIIFVYMTSPMYHIYDANTKAANEMIREYCLENDKVLYDFGDIESYDPDGTYFQFTDHTCEYYSSANDDTVDGNWATEWQDSHTEGVDWYTCDAPHSQPLSANQKAYAAWWLWARLAGWDGNSTGDDTAAPSVTVVQPNGNEKYKNSLDYEITWAASDNVKVTSVNISYSIDGGLNFISIATGEENNGSYFWTVPDNPSTNCLIKVSAGDLAGNWADDISDASFQIFGPVPGDADNDCDVDILDVTEIELIILGLHIEASDADADSNGFINVLDITSTEIIILEGP